MSDLVNNLVGDFIGFTFNNKHSSELSLMRTSDGSKYNSDLLPTFANKTIQGSGKDGTYYFGSNYSQKLIKIQVAFDNVKEEDFRNMVTFFDDKEIHELWFDETPYKAYWAKLNSPPVFEYNCFGDIGTRIYKGKGTLEFISFSSFAHARALFLDTELFGTGNFILGFENGTNNGTIHNHSLFSNNSVGTFKKYDVYTSGSSPTNAVLKNSYNKTEWIAASKLEEWPGGFALIDKEKTFTSHTATRIYNPGDINADLKVIMLLEGAQNKKVHRQKLTFEIVTPGKEEEISHIGFDEFFPEKGDKYIMVDFKLHLVYGLDSSYKKTSNVYNRYIISGDFFDIPPNIKINDTNNRYGIKVVPLDEMANLITATAQFYYK